MQKLFIFLMFLGLAMVRSGATVVDPEYQQLLEDIIAGRLVVDTPDFHQADILAKFYTASDGTGDAWLMNRTSVWSQLADTGATRRMRFPFDIKSVELLHPEYIMVLYSDNHKMCVIVKDVLVHIKSDCFDGALIDIKMIYAGRFFQHIEHPILIM